MSSHRFIYDYNTVWKFSDWAEKLSDSIDFIEYWYNLFISETKAKIESSPSRNINAFFWNRWKNDFDIYTDNYRPIPGDSFSPIERNWFAMYMQGLVYAFQTPSKTIADYYGKSGFLSAMKMFPKHHCYSVDYFIGSYKERYGLPDGVKDVSKTYN